MSQTSNWEEIVLKELLLESLKEQRRRRRWGIFFKLILIAIIIFFVVIFFIDKAKMMEVRKAPHVAVIDLDGVVAAQGGIDADRVGVSLHHAFNDKGTKGIILRINSPGGSPVQASYIYNEIRRQELKHPTIKVYAVCTDMCASAAYYIASAADYIYADPSSLVGSIGVISSGFGFVDVMKKYGVSRRLFIAGSQKGFLDPFSPLQNTEVKEMQQMLDILHDNFINAVKEGRGKRLDLTTPYLFSGRFWSGIQAKQIGLIDGYGSAGYVARELIKQKDIVNYTVKPTYLDRLADRVGASVSVHVMDSLGLNQNIHLQ